MQYLRQSVLMLLLAALPSAATVLSEGFDNVAALPGAGWAIINNSNPVGVTDWFQGNAGIFPSHAGAADAYIAANFLNADLGGNISTWLLTPVLGINNGDVLSFYTRTVDIPFLADRLEVRLSTAGASTDVGATDVSVGDFTTLLGAINPALNLAGYPTAWTQFSFTVAGLGGPSMGRYAFRYFVPDTFSNADYIGIDTVNVTPIPEPATWTGLGIGLLTLAWRYRRARS